MVSFKAAAFLSNKLNALPKQFKPPPQIAIQSTKNLSLKWNYSSMNVFVCRKEEGSLKRPQLHLNGYFYRSTAVTFSHWANSPVFVRICCALKSPPWNNHLKYSWGWLEEAKSVDICFWNEQRWLLVGRKNFVLMSQKPARTKWQRVPFIFFTEKRVISPWQMSKNQK